MTSLEERLELERDVCDLQKRIADESLLLNQKEISLKFALDELEEVKGRRKYHQRNLTHMRKEADVVDIKEFASTKRLYEETCGQYDDAQLKVAGLRKSISFYKESLSEAQNEIARCKNKLSGFGKVLKWGNK